MKRYIIYSFFLLAPFLLKGDEKLTNVLIPGEEVQISSEVNPYLTITEGAPIQGTVMVTHDSNNKIDNSSFRLGDKPLNVTFVQTVQMSSVNALVVSIYQFRLEGMKNGLYTLPPINVKVGGKLYNAPPLTVQVGGN